MLEIGVGTGMRCGMWLDQVSHAGSAARNQLLSEAARPAGRLFARHAGYVEARREGSRRSVQLPGAGRDESAEDAVLPAPQDPAGALHQRVRQPAGRRSRSARRQVCTSSRCAHMFRWPMWCGSRNEFDVPAGQTSLHDQPAAFGQRRISGRSAPRRGLLDGGLERHAAGRTAGAAGGSARFPFSAGLGRRQSWKTSSRKRPAIFVFT